MMGAFQLCMIFLAYLFLGVGFAKGVCSKHEYSEFVVVVVFWPMVAAIIVVAVFVAFLYWLYEKVKKL